MFLIGDLDQIEKYADKLFGQMTLDIDVEFTRHFLDRVNDERNKKPINDYDELIRLFKDSLIKSTERKIPKMGPDDEEKF